MKKTKASKATAMLALPLMAIIGGFFIRSLYLTVPLWIIATVCLGLAIWCNLEKIHTFSWPETFLFIAALCVFVTIFIFLAGIALIIYGIFQLGAIIILWILSAVYKFMKISGNHNGYMPF